MIWKLLKYLLYLVIAYAGIILFLRWFFKALEDLDVQQ